jgi:hypothetical protein
MQLNQLEKAVLAFADMPKTKLAQQLPIRVKIKYVLLVFHSKQ